MSERYTLDMSKCTEQSCPQSDILHDMAGQIRMLHEEVKMLRSQIDMILAARDGALRSTEDEMKENIEKEVER